jgi:hypothetical protein
MHGREANISFVKPERKIPIGRPRCRCEENIKTGIEEIGEHVDWIHKPTIRPNGGYLTSLNANSFSKKDSATQS